MSNWGDEMREGAFFTMVESGRQRETESEREQAALRSSLSGDIGPYLALAWQYM